jgi:hypothetical protein
LVDIVLDALCCALMEWIWTFEYKDDESGGVRMRRKLTLIKNWRSKSYL